MFLFVFFIMDYYVIYRPHGNNVPVANLQTCTRSQGVISHKTAAVTLRTMKNSNFAVIRTATAVTEIAVTNKTECFFESTKPTSHKCDS